MPLSITAHTASRALDIASVRRLLPTGMGSAELRELAQGLRNASVFSARMTHARAVQWLKEAVQRMLKGGMGNDKAKLRLELKQLLARLGYTPEGGFPGDEALGIPPAEPGSLQDLGSDLRINLILDTQERLMAGASQKLRGNDPDRSRIFPAWELVRISNRKVPRGSVGSGTMGWPQRFVQAGGVITRDGTQERMIALKGSPVWAQLGSSALFPDALDVDHAPFAFNSGMGLREVYYRDLPADFAPAPDAGEAETAPQADREKEVQHILPSVKASAEDLDPDIRARLLAGLKASEDKYGVLTMDRILKGGVKP
jgi:hypothetical protein